MITAVIVIYNANFTEVCEAVDSFIADGGKHIVLADNKSTTNIIQELRGKYAGNSAVSLVANGTNCGFGTGHNRGFAYLKANNLLQKYHVILNPDVKILPGCLGVLEKFMNENPDISIAVPKIFNQDMTVQYLNKEEPNLFDMFIRRFIPNCLQKWSILQNRYNRYIRMSVGYDNICEVPAASGCFMFLSADTFTKLGGFDEKIFLYMEDSDLSKRAWKYGRIMFNPNAKIVHAWKRASHTNWKMTVIFIQSILYYFRKHGFKIL